MTSTSEREPSPGDSWLTRAQAALYPLFVFAFPFAVYVQVWAGPLRERQHMFGDPRASYWPDLRTMYLGLSQGTVPLWNPYDRAGYPFCADPQTGLLYPLNWLLVLAAKLFGDLTFDVMQLKLIVHLSIAGLGMYLFLRQRALPRAAAATGGVAYQFGAFLAHNVMFALAWPAAWAPFVLWSMDRYFRAPSQRAAVVLALMTSMVVVSGSPPSVYYTALVAVPYFVCRVVEAAARESWRTWLRRVWPSLALGACVTAVLCAPQLLATKVLTEHSRLATRSFEYAAGGAIRPSNLLGLVFRSANGLYAYVGATALVLALFGVAYGRPRRDAALFFALALLGVTLAMGTHGPVFRSFYQLVPGAALFRDVRRYLFLVDFALAVLAGLGIAGLMEPGRISDKSVQRAGFGLAALFLTALYFRVSRDPRFDAALAGDVWTVAFLLALLWVAIWAMRKGAARGAFFAACALGIVCLDAGLHAQLAGVLRPGDGATTEAVSPRALRELSGTLRGFRVYSEFGLTNRPGSRLGVRDLRGYMDPLALGRYQTIVTDQLKKHPYELLRLFNVKYVLHAPHPHLGLGHHHVPSPQRVRGLKRLSASVFEVEDPAPNAFWVGSVKLVPDDVAAQRELSGIDPHRFAVMAREDLEATRVRWAERLQNVAPARAARVLARNFNTLSLQVSAPSDGVLVVNEAWFPGWQAQVDGVPTEVLRANSLVQAVPLRAGQHRVELRFYPRYFIYPCYLAALVLLALLLAWLSGRLPSEALP